MTVLVERAGGGMMDRAPGRQCGGGDPLREGSDIDLDGRGEVVGFDIDFASKRFDLSRPGAVALPLTATAAA